MSNINIRMEDGKGNIIHPESDSKLILHGEKSNVNDTLNSLEARKQIFIQEETPTKTGFWINTKKNINNLKNIDVFDRIKKYFDDKIGILDNLMGSKKKDLVSAINEVQENLNMIPNPNFLDNGDFQVWTNGTNFPDILSNVYSADKWLVKRGINVNVSKINFEGRNGIRGEILQKPSFCNIFQSINNAEWLSNKTVTLSCLVRKSLDNISDFAIGLSLDGTTFYKRDIVKINDTFQKVSFTTTLPTDITNLSVSVAFAESVAHIGYFDIMDVKLELGDTPTKFIPKSYEEEFNNCVPYRNVISNPNLLINGDFQVWQRGESFTNANGYTSDRWRILSVNPLPTITKENNTIRCEINTIFNLWQVIENASYLSGKKVTLSFDVYANKELNGVLCAIGDGIDYDNALNSVIKTYDVSTTNKRINLTFDVPNISSGNLVVTLLRTGHQSIVNVSNVKLELGSVATPFVPRLYGEELALCQRYYEKLYSVSNSVIYGTNNIATNITYFKVSKRVVPTIKTGNVFIRDSNGTILSGFTEVSNISSETTTDSFTGYLVKNSHGFSSSNPIILQAWWEADAEIY